MTDRLTGIRERAEAATPGPWSWLWLHSAGFVAQCDLPPHDITSRDIWPGPETPLIADDVSDEDGRFIAHARQDVAYLLDQIAERDAEIARLRVALVHMNAITDHQTNRVFPPMKIGDETFPTRLHPLTCGNDSNHGILFPYWTGEDAVLRCPDCDYEQSNPKTTPTGKGRPLPNHGSGP